MKILIYCSTLDLKYKMGCTPHWWQLFKSMYEIGNELIVIPFLGESIETPWWRTYPNPCYREGNLYYSFLHKKKRKDELNRFNELTRKHLINFSRKYIKKKLEKYLINTIKKENNVDAILFMNIPLTFITGIASKIRDIFSIPVAYFDGDMPIALPEYIKETHLTFSYYDFVDLSEFDAFLTNSKGAIPSLKERGAKNIHPIYFAADPEIYKFINLKKDIDISFYGHGDSQREEWIEKMIAIPSKKLQNVKFKIGGFGFQKDLCNVNQISNIPFSKFRNFCCRSNICLNIARKIMASVYASATARPFELAALGACVVSNPVNGIEEWFKLGEELIVVNDGQEAIDIYRWLLDNKTEREKMGKKARERILKEHTFHHRANHIIKILSNKIFL